MSHWLDLERYRHSNRQRMNAAIDASLKENRRILRRLRFKRYAQLVDSIVWRAISLEFIFAGFRHRHGDGNHHK